MQRHPTLAAPQPMAAPRPTGMGCPDCRGFIPVSIEQLLHDSGIVCPHCGLSLTINRMQSRQALEALRKVEQAYRRVRATESFKR